MKLLVLLVRVLTIVYLIQLMWLVVVAITTKFLVSPSYQNQLGFQLGFELLNPYLVVIYSYFSPSLLFCTLLVIIIVSIISNFSNFKSWTFVKRSGFIFGVVLIIQLIVILICRFVAKWNELNFLSDPFTTSEFLFLVAFIGGSILYVPVITFLWPRFIINYVNKNRESLTKNHSDMNKIIYLILTTVFIGMLLTLAMRPLVLHLHGNEVGTPFIFSNLLNYFIEAILPFLLILITSVLWWNFLKSKKVHSIILSAIVFILYWGLGIFLIGDEFWQHEKLFSNRNYSLSQYILFDNADFHFSLSSLIGVFILLFYLNRNYRKAALLKEEVNSTPMPST